MKQKICSHKLKRRSGPSVFSPEGWKGNLRGTIGKTKCRYRRKFCKIYQKVMHHEVKLKEQAHLMDSRLIPLNKN